MRVVKSIIIGVRVGPGGLYQTPHTAMEILQISLDHACCDPVMFEPV